MNINLQYKPGCKKLYCFYTKVAPRFYSVIYPYIYLFIYLFYFYFHTFFCQVYSLPAAKMISETQFERMGLAIGQIAMLKALFGKSVQGKENFLLASVPERILF